MGHVTAQKTSTRGGRRPDLAADLALTLSACERHVVDTPRLSLPEVIASVCTTLEHTARTTSGGPHVPDLAELLARALPGTDLIAVTEPAPVTDQVARGIAAGIDAERLYSAVLGLEACRHIPLVWHQANKLARSFPEYSPEDLLGWGWQGLRIALKAYDPTRFAFSTYACTRIAGTIRDGVRAESPVPKRLATDVRKLRRAHEDLTRELDRVPTQAELSDRLAVDPRHLEILARCRPTASIEEMTGVFDSEHTPAWLGEEPDLLAEVFAEELSRRVQAALALLDPKDAQAVQLLVLEGRALQEAAELSGASPAQLRRRKSRGLDRLRSELRDWQLL